MKLMKQILLVVFVSIVFLSFSAFGQSTNCINVDWAGQSNDIVVNRITNILPQLQNFDGKGPDFILNKNVVWNYPGVIGTVPFAGTFTGRDGVRKFWKTFFSSVICPKAQLRYFLHQGNIVHLHWTEEGIIKATGKKYIMETVQRWEFNDSGEVVKLQWYNDTYAMYQGFQPNSDPQLSLAQHPADYNINGDGPVDALPYVQNYYSQFAQGNLAAIISNATPNIAFILAGPEGLTKIAGTWIGPQGMTDFFNTLFTCETYNAFQLKTFTADGCRVDVEFSEQIVILKTGKVVDCTGLHSFVINSNGQLAKFRSYNDTYPVAWGYTE